MAGKSEYSVKFCQRCKYGKFESDFKYRCSVLGTLNHSPKCNLFKEK